MFDDLDDFEEIEFEHAIKSTGFGKFNILLLVICGLIYADTAISVSVVSFVLPSATCDFNLTSADKGVLSGTPVVGMLFGSYFWGCLADTKGRKKVLIVTLLLDGIFGLISAVCTNFYLFLIFRFLSGFSIAGAMGICFAYLGEFHPATSREEVLSWMEMFWSFGLILLPLSAWMIIPAAMNFLKDKPLHSWNLFVAATSLPSLLISGALYYFPESPKFLVEAGEPTVALGILKGIFNSNTGKNASEYPVKSLRETERKFSFLGTHQSIRTLSIRKRKDIYILLVTLWEQTKELCQPPFRARTFCTCFIQFGIFTSYYTLMLWFPNIFNTMSVYQMEHPNSTITVCAAMEDTNKDPDKHVHVCTGEIDTDAYKVALWVGIACIPSSLWLLLCVKRLGARFFLILSLVVSGVSIVLMNNSTTLLQNEVLACIFESMSSLAESSVYCILVELYPTRLRVMATALGLSFGRAGALFGSLMFGNLVDLHCFVPIAIFALLLFISAFISFFLPSAGSETPE